MVSIRLCRKKTCPPRASSRSMASLIVAPSNFETEVRMARRSTGGVPMIERSRIPIIDMCSVRGIGVAVSVSTSTSLRSFFSCSLCFTPKRCSSSITTSPRSLKETSAESSRWVPMTTSTLPSRARLRVSLVRGPRGVDVQQLGGHLEQLFLDPGFALLEGLALERVEPDLLGVAARVLLDLPQPPDRQVQLVLAGEVQKDEIGRESAHVQPGEPVVSRDAVIDVHHQVAFFQVAEVGPFVPEGARPARRPARLGAGPEDVLVGEEGQPGVQIDEPRADLADHQMGMDVRRE